MAKKKSKAKIHKARVVKVQELDVDKHLIGTEYEVHGPLDLPLPVAPDRLAEEPLVIEPGVPEDSPEKHWYDFLKDW